MITFVTASSFEVNLEPAICSDKSENSSADISFQWYVYFGCNGAFIFLDIMNAVFAFTLVSIGSLNSLSRKVFSISTRDANFSMSRAPNVFTTARSTSKPHHSSQ